MAYRLYFDDFSAIRNYENSQNVSMRTSGREKYFYDKVTPLKFRLSGVVKDSFKIEEIDSLTCSFKDAEEFITEVKKHDISYLSPYEQETEALNLVYRTKGSIKQAPIIFDDLLLLEQATNLRSKKKNSKKSEKVLTDNTEKLMFFIESIKSMASDTMTKDFLLSPKNISYLTLEEKEYLNMDIIVGQSKIEIGEYGENYIKIVKPGIRPLLEEYVRLQAVYHDGMRRNETTVGVEQDLREINKEINLFFRKDYRNLRKMVEWENRYLEILINSLKNKTLSEEQQLMVISQIEKVQNNKKDRCRKNKKIDTFVKQKVNEISDVEKNINSFENERIDELYRTGGIEAVMEGIDLDEILSSEEDAERLGIIPKRK